MIIPSNFAENDDGCSVFSRRPGQVTPDEEGKRQGRRLQEKHNGMPVAFYLSFTELLTTLYQVATRKKLTSHFHFFFTHNSAKLN